MFEFLAQLPGDAIKEYGPVGALSFFLLLDKLGYYRKKSAVLQIVTSVRANQKETVKRFDNSARQLNDLHTWHAPDTDGEQNWKNKHMIEVLKKLTDVVDNQTRVMDRLLPILERLEAKV